MTALGTLLDKVFGHRAAGTEEYAIRLAQLDPVALLDAALLATPTELAAMCEESHPHVNGFDKVSFPARPGRKERLRLHIWPGDDSAAGIEADAHDHRWSMVSRILVGTLRNTIFTVTPGTGRRHFRHRLDRAAFGYVSFTDLGTADLAVASEDDYPAGAIYTLSHEKVHTVRRVPGSTDPTVTLALELAPVGTETDVYPAKDGLPFGKTTHPHPPCFGPAEVLDRLRRVRRLLAVASFRDVMRAAYREPAFKHQSWYVPYHLELVERLTHEFRRRYPSADPDLVILLVWLHDYGKALGGTSVNDVTLCEGRRRLRECGLDEEITDQVVVYADMLDRATQLDLTQAPLEVQIVSSADGCAHLTGPFFHLYWWENPGRPYEELMAENLSKLHKDWTYKIVLPEARAAFESRYLSLREQSGKLPERFID